MEENNQNDNLITEEKPNPQNNQNPYFIVTESSDEPVDLTISQKSECFYLVIPLYIFFGIGIICASIAFKFVFKRNEYLGIVLIVVLPFLLLLYLCKRKLILRKKNKQLTILEHNYLFCKKEYDFSLENINATIKPSGFFKCNFKMYYLSTLIIYGIDPNKINFNTDYIKNAPFKLFYLFKHCIIDHNTLYNFLGINSSGGSIYNEINSYMPDSKEKTDKGTVNLPKINYQQFLKLSEHYYCYLTYDLNYKVVTNENFQRIDWIYSENYDQIFIGVVKNDKSYLNTLTYNSNLINRYVLELKGDKYLLKIIFHDSTEAQICQFKKNFQEYSYYSLNENLNALLYLLNGQLNKINNKNNNNNENSAPTVNQ